MAPPLTGGCPGHSKALAIFAAAVAVAFGGTGIIQSLITSCSRRDQSYARQAQIVFGKFMGAGDGRGGIAQRGWSVISTIALFVVWLKFKNHLQPSVARILKGATNPKQGPGAWPVWSSHGEAPCLRKRGHIPKKAEVSFVWQPTLCRQLCTF